MNAKVRNYNLRNLDKETNMKVLNFEWLAISTA